MKSFFKLTLLLVLSITGAISSHEEEFCTPVRATVAARAIEPTPGQRLCQRQAVLLRKEKFVPVLGQQIVDGWGIDWDVFMNSSLSFDDPQKRQGIRFISNRMKIMPETKIDGEARSLYLEVLGLQGDAEGIHAERLDTLALTYFSRVFLSAELIPEMKLGGVQLGERIIVSQPRHPDLTFHIKTHSAGRLSSNSTAAKLVNPQELMAYKVLQHLGIGCESHFFQRSPEDVYIATLDASTGGNFTLFEVMSGHLGLGGDDTVGRNLSGKLIDISQDPRQLNREAIEASVTQDAVAQNFITEMARLDIITRICRLHDLLNNPGNFGFFESCGQPLSIRVIDFRIMETRIFKIDNGDFGGFLVGNGLYQYAGSHKTMRYVLHDRPCQARVETAKSIMSSGLADSIKRATQVAHREVMEYLSQDVFESRYAELLLKLEEYAEALMHNADFFFSKLYEWKPE